MPSYRNVTITDGRGKRTKIGGQPPITTEAESVSLLNSLVQNGAWVGHEGRWLGWSERLAYARSRLTSRSTLSTTEAALLQLLSQMSSLEMSAATAARTAELVARAEQMVGPMTTTTEPSQDEAPADEDDVAAWMEIQVPPDVRPEPSLDLLK